MNLLNYLKIVILPVLMITINSCNNSQFDLHEGDLLFKQKIDNSFSEAIVATTSGIDKYNFTHVGVAHKQNNKWYVIEAISKGVCMTAVNEYLEDSSIVVIGRLKPEYKEDVLLAVENIIEQIGKPYDNYFSSDNDAYYCSELIQQHYIHNNSPIFKPIKMTFKDKQTGEYPKYWKEHFAKLNAPIPEGELGSNPGDLSKSTEIRIIGRIK